MITTGTMVAYSFYLLAVLFHKKVCLYRDVWQSEYAYCGRKEDGEALCSLYRTMGISKEVLQESHLWRMSLLKIIPELMVVEDT